MHVDLHLDLDLQLTFHLLTFKQRGCLHLPRQTGSQNLNFPRRFALTLWLHCFEVHQGYQSCYQKTRSRVPAQPDDESHVILSSLVLTVDTLQRVTDRQTDRQTDRHVRCLWLSRAQLYQLSWAWQTWSGIHIHDQITTKTQLVLYTSRPTQSQHQVSMNISSLRYFSKQHRLHNSVPTSTSLVQCHIKQQSQTESVSNIDVQYTDRWGSRLAAGGSSSQVESVVRYQWNI